MQIQPYTAQELSLAYCYHVYFRWRSYRRREILELGQLDAASLNELVDPYDIRVLEAQFSPSESLLPASLRPEASVAAAASTIKGTVSKWVREHMGLAQPTELLAKGYFACTCGKSTSQAIEQYLDRQSDHHGYSDRARPPIFVGNYPLLPETERKLQANHAATVLQYHLVIATWHRQGVFSDVAAQAVADGWRKLELELRFSLRKVSFVPDHVHVAVKAHPALSPEMLIVRLLNSSQERMWDRFSENVIRAGVERLWQPGRYVGSYGDLASPQVSQYLRNWAEEV